MKKLLWVYLAVALIAVPLFAACQATPEKPVVIQKDMEQMIEKAQGTDNTAPETPEISLREQTGSPEKLAMENTKGNFTLSADAVVSVPGAAGMPIVRVKAGEFTQAQVTAYWDALVGDAVLWEHKTELTKSEIEEQLVSLRKSIIGHEDDPAYAQAIEVTKEQIEYLESIYPTAR